MPTKTTLPPAPAKTTKATKGRSSAAPVKALPSAKPRKTARPAVQAAPPAPVPAVKTPKAPKKAPKVRAKLVRDSFTMPEADFSLIATLKSRALGAHRHAKKSELLRAGLQALAAMDAKTLLDSLDRLEPVKIGRPKNS